MPLRSWHAALVTMGMAGTLVLASGGCIPPCSATASAAPSAATPVASAQAVGSGGPTASPGSLQAAEVLQRLRQSVGAIRDARARVEAQVVEVDGRRIRSVVDAWVLRQPALVRLQVVEPSTLADQIYLVDFERRLLYVYLPITHQVVVQSMDTDPSGNPALAQLGPAVWLQPVPSGFERTARVVKTEVQAGKTRLVVEGAVKASGAASPSSATSSAPRLAATASTPGDSVPLPAGDVARWAGVEAATLQLWVDASTWLIERLVAYDARGREVATVTLQGLRVNTGLKAQELRRFPEGAELVRG